MKVDIKQSLKELKSYSPIPFKTFIQSDNLIHEPKSTDFTENNTAVLENVSSLQKLLKLDFACFLRNIVENEKLLQFLESYLTYRSKPYIDIIATSKSTLFLLDKLVSFVFYRLTTPQNEHHLLPHLLPRPHFTVHKVGKPSPESEDSNDKSYLDEQYKLFLQSSVKILKFPYLLNLIGIMGDSNQVLRSDIYHRIYQLVDSPQHNFLKDIHRSMQETQAACSEVLINIWQLYSTMENTQLEVSAGSTKKSLQNMITNKRDSHSIVYSTIKELNHLVSFLVDIVYSWYSWLQVVDGKWLIEESGFFSADGVQLSKHIGQTFYELLQLIFEPIVAVSVKVFNSLQAISSSTNESIQTLMSSTGMRITCHEEEKSEYSLYASQLPKCFSLIQFYSFKTVHLLVSTAHHEEMHRRKHAKSGKEKSKSSVPLDEGISWLEMWSKIVPIADHLFAVDLSFITATGPSAQATSTASSSTKASAKQQGKKSNGSTKTTSTVTISQPTQTVNMFFHLGTLISDYIKFARKYLPEQAQTASSKSKKENSLIEELVQYTLSQTMGIDNFDSGEGESILKFYIQTLQIEDTSMLPVQSVPSSSSVMNKEDTNVSKKNSAPAGTQAPPNAEDISDKIQQIQMIFPDFGKGYLEACLQFYKFKTEEVIDALLTNNIHPSLSQLDPKLEKIWIGKNSLQQTSSNILLNKINTGANAGNKANSNNKKKIAAKEEEAGVDYKAYLNTSISSNQQFSALQKKIIAEQERQRMYDAYVVEKELYNDDYDDTFDAIDSVVKPAVLAAQRSYTTNVNSMKLPKRGAIVEDGEEAFEEPALTSIEEQEDDLVDKDTLLYEGFNDDEVTESMQSLELQSTATAAAAAIDTTSINKSSKSKKQNNNNNNNKNTAQTAPKEDWKQQMQDMRRYNSLLRQEEAEVKYWEDMQNPNRIGGNTIKTNKHAWKDDVKEAERIVAQEEEERQQQFQALRNPKQHRSVLPVGATSNNSSTVSANTASTVTNTAPEGTRNTNTQGQGKKGGANTDKGNAGGGKNNQEPKKSKAETSTSSGNTTGDHGKPHRTKTFDKHHQKDKALRKGGF